MSYLFIIVPFEDSDTNRDVKESMLLILQHDLNIEIIEKKVALINYINTLLIKTII